MASAASGGPSEPRIGLCLSGGGFRAALYGLGVVRYLAEAGHLGRIAGISAVSGGSIAAAYLADRWPRLVVGGLSAQTFVDEVEQPLHAKLAHANLRNRALLRWVGGRLLIFGPNRTEAAGKTLVRHLFEADKVVDLDPGLQVILTSTDLGTGRAFRVAREFVGNWDFGYGTPPPALELATAVGASAAVPMIFAPIGLKTDGLGLEDPPPVLSLVDGGVYDNLGLEWFQGWSSGRPDSARPADFLIVADASGLLEAKPRRYRGLRAINRVRAVQYFQTRAARIRWLVDRMLAGTDRGVFFNTKSDPKDFRLPDGSLVDPALAAGALPVGFGLALAGLRTDLDRFSPEESSLLAYHGYWSIHTRLAALHPQLAVSEPQWTQWAGMEDDEAARLLNVLAAGAKLKAFR